MSVSFDIELDCLEEELQQWPDGYEDELEPKDEVLERFEDRLTELIQSKYTLLKRINLYTDGECLMAIND